jgi:tetratricopeptide (TPR) repeat protein
MAAAGEAILLCAGVALGVAFAFPASAQIDVTPTGRRLDANPAVGGDGSNFARPVSPLMRGNQIATGNVRGGFGLRSFSPIGDPSAFQASLGSGSLSGFVRDSVGIADAYNRSALGFGARPYFDASSTAPTGTFLQRQGAYQTPFAQSGGRGTSSVMPGQLDFAAPVLATRNPFGDRQELAGEARWELSSTVFGVNPLMPDKPDSLSLPSSPGAYSSEFDRGAGRAMPALDPTASAGDDRWMPLDYRLPMPALEDQPRSSTEAALRLDPMALLAERADQMSPSEPRTSEPTAQFGARVDPSLIPGQSVFTDMRMALSLRDDPGAAWFEDMREAMRSDPTLATELRQAADEQSEELVQRMMDTSISTFVGAGEAPVNESLLRAELLMDSGEYHEAAMEYERASMHDPVNPLPLLGKAHAHLAAGEYLSASHALERGLERFPELASFRVDLESLMGGGEIVDIRRADLIELLKRNDNARLRFLLGYIEVHSGNGAYGIQNLDKAAEAAEFGSFIRRYPVLLRQAGIVPSAPGTAAEDRP